MSKLKIKAQFLPERCEIYHQKDRFDPQLNHCLRCSPPNQPLIQPGCPAFETIAATAPDICPRNISIVIGSDSCTLTYKWVTGYSIFLLLASITFSSLLLFERFNQISRNPESTNFNLTVTTIVLILMAILNYFAIANCFNKTTIRATSSEIIISHGPFPWFYNRRFTIRDISRVYVDEDSDREGYSWYRIRVGLKDESVYTITPYTFNSKKLYFISDQLFKWVRVLRNTNLPNSNSVFY